MINRTTILIVDDEPFIMQAAARLLTAGGFDVITCEEWVGVPRLIRENNPALVLLDYNMPTIKGDNICTILKRNTSSATKIVLFSSESEMDLVRITGECGADGYIKKDTAGNTLVDRVSAYVPATVC